MRSKKARIYKPAKSATQSGRARTHQWVLEFEPMARREADPLMGWISSPDMEQQVRLRFATPDEAVAYAKRKAIPYTLEAAREAPLKLQSYADNFR